MEFEKIVQLIEAVSKSNLTQFSIEDGDLKLSMKTDKQTKMIAAPVMASMAGPVMEAGMTAPQAVIQSSPAIMAEGTEAEQKLSGNIVKSPLVGTFYSSSSPDADAFVKVGDTVKKGQVLGIVEAMKLMNEIESEFDGVVEQILVKNEHVVEYGQPMFVIK